MNEQQLEQKRLAMEEMLREIGAEARTREELQIETHADALDQIQSANEREFAVIRLDKQARLARELRAALKKISAGTYGICEECDDPIAPRRLEALPFAKLCVHCQAQAENNGEHPPEDPLFEQAA